MENILVIQGARLGDLIQTKRLVLSVSRFYTVHIAVDIELVEMARIIYPNCIIHGLHFHSAMPSEIMAANKKVFHALRNLQFSYIYACNLSPLISAVTRLFAQNKIIGYRPAHVSEGGQTKSAWLRLAFRLSQHRASTPLNLVDLWGHMEPLPISPYKINPVPSPRGGGLGVVIAGRVEQRSIPLSAMALMIDITCRVLKVPTIKLFGSSHEIPRSRKLLRLLQTNSLGLINNLCGKTNWKSLCEEMQGLDLLITPDTGLMHLGAHLGIPVVAVFLASALAHETGPYGEGHIIFQSLPDCAPCLESAKCAKDCSCASVFNSPAFIKAFAAVITHKECPELPVGLQLWRTGIDKLGVYLKLLGGRDEHAAARMAKRALIEECLLLDDSFLADNPLKEEILGGLVPFSEWALPPERYCE